MAPLAILTAVRAHDGDYQLAGTLNGIYAVSLAVAGPILGRVIDHTRQTPVLLASAVLSAVGFWMLAALDPVANTTAAVVAAVVAGAATPQLEPCLRVLWEDVLSSERDVRAAFSLDAGTQELIFVFGPLVVMGASALGGASSGLTAAAGIGLVGTVWFATARPARVWRGNAQHRHWAGPLRSSGMVRLFLALVGVGGTIGAFTVGITGYAEEQGIPGAAGWLIAANAGGALVAGIAYTAVPASRNEGGRFRLLAVLFTAGYTPLLLLPGVPLMAPLAFLSGCALPAVLASAFALVARLAPHGTVTEAHAWMITSFGVGNAAGSAVAGLAIDTVAAQAALGAGVCFAAGAAGLTAVTLLRPEYGDSSGEQ